MNKYKILEPKPIDERSSYITLLAKNLKKDDKVAIKILKKNFYSLDDCKRHKEVQVLQKLNHKNVQRMLELINDRDELLMVLEYEPDNVKSVMQNRCRPYTESETKVIMQQVFQGLSHVHEMGYIHRTLRPEVLLCDKEATAVKISDFSMAKSDLDSLGEYNSFPCWYMSPEVLLGANDYSNKIDTWAAGCIMAELLTCNPLLPGTSDRDQMKLICELLGKFSKSQWPDGDLLRRSLGYKLPASEAGKGLGDAGVQATSEAKGLIMSLLTWAPGQRMSAEMAVRHDFFKSDGEFINKEESQEILKSKGKELEQLRNKWEKDLNRGFVTELDGILAGINNKQTHRDRYSNRHNFAGFEKSNPLLGDSSPRKLTEAQTNGTVNVTKIDDPFRIHRPKVINEPPVRTYPLDVESPNRSPDRTPFEEELMLRENRRSRQGAHNVEAPFAADGQISPQREPLVAADGHMSPRRNNISPRRKINDHIGLLGGGPDENQMEQEQKEKQKMLQAELCKQTNPLKYKEKFKLTRGFFGADSPQPGEKAGPLRSRQVGYETSQTDGQKPPIRSRMASSEKCASMDYTAKAEKYRFQNPNRHRDNSFMSELLGKKPEPKPSPQSSQLQQNYGNGGDQGFENNGQYTPSWTDNNTMRTH